jgi:hypothetical protein
MSKYSELREWRSEVIHFKNEYKFMILKSTMMPQIKEAFVGSQYKYKNLHYQIHSGSVLMSRLQAQQFQENGICYLC